MFPLSSKKVSPLVEAQQPVVVIDQEKNDNIEEQASVVVPVQADEKNTSSNNPLHHDNNDAVNHPRAFQLTLISNALFFIASALYLYLSLIQYEYEKEVEDFPDTVLQADDDAAWYELGYEDDYVFQTPLTKTYISEYTIIYFLAALSFVIAGLVDLYQWRDLFSIIMILAASFGLAAAIVGETNGSLSSIFSAISVHLWVVDAIIVMTSKDSFFGGHKNLKVWLSIANGCFVIATGTEVVLSWFYIFRDPLRAGITIAIFEIMATCFWLVSATIYVAATLVVGARMAAKEEPKSPSSSQQQQKEFVSQETTSDTETETSGGEHIDTFPLTL